jgi:SAM-dependent methyltransferase
MMSLRETFGEIDVYLFDQMLKDRFTSGSSILDAGCGGGRNLIYFLRNAYEVCAVDQSVEAVEHVRSIAAKLNGALPLENFRVAAVEAMPFADARFDVVISSAVLHFARDEAHFNAMLAEMWRVLKPGGIFFARLASTIGIEGRVRLISERWYQLPDGSERFLVDEALLFAAAERLGAGWLEPLKTTNVENKRCMTTWVLRKPN